MEPRLISVADFCTMLGIGKTKAYAILGAVESIKIGRRRLILMDSVGAFIAAASATTARQETGSPANPDQDSSEYAR